MNTLSTGAASRPALSRGAVRGHVAILALFLVAIMSQLSPQASADENKSVNVSNLSLTRVDGNNIEQDGKLSYYDLARLSFDWAASTPTSSRATPSRSVWVSTSPTCRTARPTR